MTNDASERVAKAAANAEITGTAAEPGGRRGRLRGVAARLAELAQLRLELFAIDVELGAVQLLVLAVLVMGALGLALVGLTLLVVALLLVAPESWRWAVAAAIGLGCWGGCWFMLRRARQRLQGWRPFAATMAELRRDRELL
ncbi:MAG: phage holin family protein [Paucibacter sp.]|nr:phage holin family protein [Roseateles sp.]